MVADLYIVTLGTFQIGSPSTRDLTYLVDETDRRDASKLKNLVVPECHEPRCVGWLHDLIAMSLRRLTRLPIGYP